MAFFGSWVAFVNVINAVFVVTAESP